MNSSNNTKAVDMTTGSILGPVLIFALPIILGNILQLLYTTIDTLILGNFCDHNSLAAVGTSSQPIELLLCIFIGVGSGVSILVAQYRGANDPESTKCAIHTAVSFTYIVGVPMMLIGQLLGPLLLYIMQTPDEAVTLARAYVGIVLLASLGNIGYNVNAGILRGLGDSKASLRFLALSCLVNIVLDYIFVGICGLDVYGAAAATAIAMIASWIFSIAYIRKKYPEVEFNILPAKYDREMMKRILHVGIPLGLNNSLYAVGHIALQSLINLQGTVFAAGCNISKNINGVSGMIVAALASSATTFSGQNYGARKFDRLREGSWKILGLNVFVSGVIGMLMAFVFCDTMLGWFTDEAEVIYYGARYVKIVLPFQWCYAALCTVINYVNGAGEVKYSTLINLLMLWAVRIPAAFIINALGYGGYVMWSMPISFIFGMTFMVGFLFSKRWKRVLAGETL